MSETQDQVWTVLKTLQWTTDYFRDKGCDAPRLDAELLLAHALQIDRIQLYVQYERPMTPDERASYRQLVRRRASREPTAYILGEREFWSLSFAVRPGVLIPRPDTETLVQQALGVAEALSPEGEPALRIADVGTGSGCVAISLAHERPDAFVWAGDVADAPLAVAPENAARAGVADRVQVVRGPGLTPLLEASGPGGFHIVVSNPPYIRDGDFQGLMPEVRNYEPRGALTSGADGLDVIRALISDASRPGALVPGGALLIEVGSGHQADEIVGLMRRSGFVTAEIVQDLSNRPRVVVGHTAEA